MVDQLDVNHKVGIVEFDIRDDNLIDSDLLVKMVNNYHNVYHIYIFDIYN